LRGWSVTARAEEWEKITEPVHLAHHLPAERREASVLGLVGARVGPVDVGRVGEGHVAGAQPVEGSQRAERVLDRVAALHPHHRRDLAALERIERVLA